MCYESKRGMNIYLAHRHSVSMIFSHNYEVNIPPKAVRVLLRVIQIHVCKDTFILLCMVSCFSVDGIDFIASVPMFNFGMGPVSQACIDVDIIDDNDLEGDHTFTVELGAASPLGTGSPTSTTITIQDPEGIYL